MCVACCLLFVRPPPCAPCAPCAVLSALLLLLVACFGELEIQTII